MTIRATTPWIAALLHEDPLRVAAWPALLGLSAGATLRGCVDGNSGSDHKHSFLIGLGTRVRVLDTVYVSAEYVPRVSGFANGDDDLSVACE